MMRHSLDSFESSSIQSSDKDWSFLNSLCGIRAWDKCMQIGVELTWAKFIIAIINLQKKKSGSSHHISMLRKPLMWGSHFRSSAQSLQMASVAAETTGREIVVVFWPKHGLRSNLNFPGGHASKIPLACSHIYAHPSPQWLYHSKTAGSAPELYTPYYLSITVNCISREFFFVVVCFKIRFCLASWQLIYRHQLLGFMLPFRNV